MASPVQAQAVVIYAKIGSVYYPVACAKDVSITTTSDFLELAPRSSSIWREYEYGRITGEISGSGITKINTGVDSLYTIFDIFGQQFSQLKFLVKYSAYDPEGNYKVFECNVLVRELNLAGSASALSNYTYSFQISGPITITSTPVQNTNPQILTYEYEASGAVSSLVISAISAEATLLVVYIDTDGTGGVSQTIILAPSGYGTDEVQWDSNTRTLTFGTALASGDRLKVIYVDTSVLQSPYLLEDGSGNTIEDGLGNEILTQ
jgi:hypothetical protein